MSNKKFNKKSVVALGTMFMFSIPAVVMPTSTANAGGAMLPNRLVRSASTVSRMGRLTQPGTGRIGQTGTGRIGQTGTGRIGQTGTGGIRSNSLPNLPSSGDVDVASLQAQVRSLSQGMDDMVAANQAAAREQNSPFNQAVMASGLVSSITMVIGIIVGAAQQASFITLTNEQAEEEAALTQDLNQLADNFQKVEVVEAEEDIIEYYMDNYGIDLTKPQ